MGLYLELDGEIDIDDVVVGCMVVEKSSGKLAYVKSISRGVVELATLGVPPGTKSVRERIVPYSVRDFCRRFELAEEGNDGPG